MANMFTGDNDHGDAVPSTEVLLQIIAELRRERDYARQLYCSRISTVTSTYVESKRRTPEQIAHEMGWDCIKQHDKSVANSYDNIINKHHTTFHKLAQENTNEN